VLAARGVAGALAKTFVEFHRFTAVSYKPPLPELLAGAAALLAEYNGIDRAAHVRDKLAALIMYLETVRGLTKAAALEARLRAGIAVPDVVYTNAAKYYSPPTITRWCGWCRTSRGAS